MAMNVGIKDEQILGNSWKVSMFMLADSHTEVSILDDSGWNFHLTPLKEDPKSTGTVNRSCMFGNKEVL